MRIFCNIQNDLISEYWLVETDAISIETDEDDGSLVYLVYMVKSPYYDKPYKINTYIHSDYIESAFTNAMRLLEDAFKTGYLDLRKFKSEKV